MTISTEIESDGLLYIYVTATTVTRLWSEYFVFSTPQDQDWFHLAVRWTHESGLDIYINGTLADEEFIDFGSNYVYNYENPYYTSPIPDMKIGKYGNYYMYGYLDELKLWETGLGVSQIIDLASMNVPT